MPPIAELLQVSSRTFALSIPRLPQPTDHEATVAYLLMRLADGFEDANHAPVAPRVDGLRAFCALMDRPDDAGAFEAMEQAAAVVAPVNPAERAVFEASTGLIQEYACLRPNARAVVGATCRRMAEGMIGWIARTGPDGALRLTDLGALRDYCYDVAGIVGEMLTELFVMERPQLAGVTPRLRALAPDFGEGVQLVNILKDAAADA